MASILPTFVGQNDKNLHLSGLLTKHQLQNRLSDIAAKPNKSLRLSIIDIISKQVYLNGLAFMANRMT